MQFIVYDTNQNPETASPPTPEMMAEMGSFIEEATKAGVVVTTGGLTTLARACGSPTGSSA